MRKLIFALFVLSLLSLNPPFSYAQDAESTSPSATPPVDNSKAIRKLKLQQRLEKARILQGIKRAEIKTRIEERKATRAARLAEARKVRIRNFFARLYRRFRAAITRLDRLITRIESRIAKIEENNQDIDTSSVNTSLQEARDLLTQAGADVDALNDSFEEALESEDPKHAFEVIKDTVHQVKDNLVKVHRILVLLIGDIKGLRVGKSEGGVEESTPIPTVVPTIEPTTVPLEGS